MFKDSINLFANICLQSSRLKYIPGLDCIVFKFNVIQTIVNSADFKVMYCAYAKFYSYISFLSGADKICSSLFTLVATHFRSHDNSAWRIFFVFEYSLASSGVRKLHNFYIPKVLSHDLK